jgi:hypothetical protein
MSPEPRGPALISVIKFLELKRIEEQDQPRQQGRLVKPALTGSRAMPSENFAHIRAN